MTSPNEFEFSFLPARRARGGSSDPLSGVGRKDQRELVVTQDRLRLEALELGLEVREILEAPVNAREEQCQHAFEPPEPAQHPLADPLRLDLPATPPRLARDPVGELRGGADRDRALVRRPEHSADGLGAVEPLAPAVALAHHEHRALDPLVGREALLAAGAFAPATDRGARLGEAGIHHARRFELAVGATHSALILLGVVLHSFPDHNILWWRMREVWRHLA